MGITDIFKKIFRRGEDEGFEDIGKEDVPPDFSFERPPTESFTAPQNPFGQPFQQFPTQQTPPQQYETFPPPSFPSPREQIQYSSDQIRILSEKIELLNAKLDQVIQRLSLIEQYLRYYYQR